MNMLLPRRTVYYKPVHIKKKHLSGISLTLHAYTRYCNKKIYVHIRVTVCCVPHVYLSMVCC